MNGSLTCAKLVMGECLHFLSESGSFIFLCEDPKCYKRVARCFFVKVTNNVYSYFLIFSMRAHCCRNVKAFIWAWIPPFSLIISFLFIVFTPVVPRAKYAQIYRKQYNLWCSTRIHSSCSACKMTIAKFISQRPTTHTFERKQLFSNTQNPMERTELFFHTNTCQLHFDWMCFKLESISNAL